MFNGITELQAKLIVMGVIIAVLLTAGVVMMLIGRKIEEEDKKELAEQLD
jgi:hypothetical protein